MLEKNNKEILKDKNIDFDEELTTILLSDNVLQVFTNEYLYNKNFRKKIDDYIPEVKLCYKQQQRNQWHIYDVMNHILHAVDEMNKLTVKLAYNERKMLAFTMFFHDLGKPEYHKVIEKNNVEYDSFKGHPIGSNKIARRVLKHLKFKEEEQKIILILVQEHDVFLKFSENPKNDWQVKPTIEYLKNYIKELNRYGDGKKILNNLILVGKADNRAQNQKTIKASFEIIEKIQTWLMKF